MSAHRPPGNLPVYDALEERERLLEITWDRLDPQFRTPNQVLGRRSTIGCVALEITQRCNLWTMRGALWRRERLGKITFFIHNFMDAEALDEERVRNCSFMVMTADGPVSMCAHNARRDDYVLRPVVVDAAAGRYFEPRTGRIETRADAVATTATFRPRPPG